MKNKQQIVVMTVAGFDPSAGAGILADIKTMSAFGCYGIAAVTSLTLQNTQGVFGAYHQDRESVRGQMGPLFDDFDVAAVKTGMLPSAGVIQEVADAVRANGVERLVVDPVVTSTSGFDLIDDEALDALITCLFPLASLVTPNAAEAERITGIHVNDGATMQAAAEAILALGPRAVLVKGGDVQSEKATDLLLDSTGGATGVTFSVERVRSKSTHGTGCTLASALACLLARGHALRDSVPVAKRYVYEAIRSAPGLGRGHGPLNHFPPEFNR
ncbi:MAG TPA: bifunctional hydroxymethylpyrimidine kinase/phosphomethylpyrimidine kinase [Blastocatellia bacterium]|jgi:hydroxymethylpyrimidine kinase/phosphomethylpyrimidine kinase|nr:bifunctional hydroxymethylpyrimidine kinase/phosphomethylpyrimidine kinase [Blastocatellia bacterium]